jgi:hypothetical protein
LIRLIQVLFYAHGILCDVTSGRHHAAQFGCRPNTHSGFGDQVFGAGSDHFAGHFLFFDLYPIFYFHLEMRFQFSFDLGRTLLHRYQVYLRLRRLHPNSSLLFDWPFACVLTIDTDPVNI